ncbi:MAG: hypothetical protein Q8P21_01990, partial [bacterium]|nr:hypothetical protein [bacterium]
GSDSDITVPYNSVVTIDWGSNYAISCTATGDYPSWQGPIAGSGASKTAPLTDDYTFGMTCTGSGGTTSSDSVKVKVSGKPASAPVTSSCSIDVQPNSYVLTTSIGSGSGTITGSGISCPGDCSEAYSSPTQVTLFATPAANGTFSSWSSGSGSICGGQGGTCSALIDSNKTATANFSTLASFDYTLSNSGTSNVTKTSGDAYTQNTITKTLVSGGTQAVTLSLSGVPNGTSYSISNTACAPNCTSVITFTVSPSTAVGTYQITVTGSPLNKQTTFNLVVSGNPVTVTCSASHSRALIGESVTWSAAISGGVPPLTYSWSGTNVPSNPAPNTNPFSISYNTIGQKTSVITVTDADGAQASCPATTVVYINFDPLLEEF